MNRSLVDFTWRGGSLRDRARLHAGGMPMGVRLRSVALLGSGMSWPMPYAASSTLHPQRVAHRWFGMSVTAAHRVLGTRTDATENEIREVPDPDPNPNPYPNRNPDPYQFQLNSHPNRHPDRYPHPNPTRNRNPNPKPTNQNQNPHHICPSMTDRRIG